MVKGELQYATVYIRIILVFLNTCTLFRKDERFIHFVRFWRDTCLCLGLSGRWVSLCVVYLCDH